MERLHKLIEKEFEFSQYCVEIKDKGDLDTCIAILEVCEFFELKKDIKTKEFPIYLNIVDHNTVYLGTRYETSVKCEIVNLFRALIDSYKEALNKVMKNITPKYFVGEKVGIIKEGDFEYTYNYDKISSITINKDFKVIYNTEKGYSREEKDIVLYEKGMETYEYSKKKYGLP